MFMLFLRLNGTLLVVGAAIMIGGCLGTKRDVTNQTKLWPKPFVPGTKIRLLEDVFLYRSGMVMRIGDTPYDSNVPPPPPSMPRTVEEYEAGKDDGGEIIGVVRNGTQVVVRKIIEVKAINIHDFRVYGTVLNGELEGEKIKCATITTATGARRLLPYFMCEVVDSSVSEMEE